MTRLRDCLDEARNIKGDIGNIKKTITQYVKNKKALEDKMFGDIKRQILNVAKSVDVEVFDTFVDKISDMTQGRFQNDIEFSDIESIARDIEIEMFYSKGEK
jgi:hypothetical protein